jgi:hypothetical protein
MAPPRNNHDPIDQLAKDLDELKADQKAEVLRRDAIFWEQVNLLKERIHAIERWQSLCYGVAGVGGLIVGHLLEKLLS